MIEPAAVQHEQLPETLPIFPLGGVLLLPRSELPLHIFEQRYRAMTRDALAGDGIIGMVQPVDAEAGGSHPPVYPTGCAGRITACRKTDDGRFYFTLIGLCRFRIRDELPLRDGYRRVTADFASYYSDLEEPPARDVVDRVRLLNILNPYCEKHGIAVNGDAIKTASDERLVATLSMLCPFEPNEKQALLEAGTLAERGRVIIALMEMTLLDQRAERHSRH